MNNRGFVSLLAIFTIPPMVLMSFLAAGSYIYIDFFGLSEQTFGYAFAFNALCASFGPSIYIKLSQKVAVEKIITTCFLTLMLCGVLTYNLAHLSPFIFAFIAATAIIMVIIIRVPGVNLMLNQKRTIRHRQWLLFSFFYDGGSIRYDLGYIKASGSD